MKNISTKFNKSQISVLPLILWHVISAGLLLAYMFVDVEVGIVIAPIFSFSILMLAAIAVAAVGTGFCTARFAMAGYRPFPAVLISCILPIACAAVLTVIEVFALFGIGDFASDAAMYIGMFGNGLFSVIGMLVSSVFQNKLGVFESYVSFAVLIASSVVGYCLGTLRSVKE
ncbi:MAG: hypothetical protein MJ101_02240 [Clostridia bacterium]|nr:hypothetical protein [Clostridia bacterium]